MSLHEEVKKFIVVSESLFNGTVKTEELTSLEVGMIPHYLREIDKKLPARPSPSQ